MRRSPRLALLALAALVAAGAAWKVLCKPKLPDPEDRPRAEATSTAIGLPPAVRTAREGADLLGLNEAVGVAELALGHFSDPLRERASLDLRALRTRDLGVTQVRANSHVYPNLSWDGGVTPWDPRRADRFLKAAGNAGLEVVMVVGPWPGARTAEFTERYLPDDLDAYAAWVAQVVERYDGDGVDDAPDLPRPVRTWEVDNEPDLHNAVLPRDGTRTMVPGTFETPAEYAAVLRATSRAIRTADPDARVLSGGIYRPMTTAGRDYLAAVLAQPGVREAIDGVSLHCYFSEDHLEVVHATMETARTLAPGLPVWITETSVPSEGKRPWISPEWQARMLVGLHGAFLAEGADRIFWHTLATPPRTPGQGPRGFAANALLKTGTDGAFEEKPAAATYRRLAALLREVDPGSLREVPADGGRLLETDRGWLAFQGTPVPPEGVTDGTDLLTGAPGAAPLAAPAWYPR